MTIAMSEVGTKSRIVKFAVHELFVLSRSSTCPLIVALFVITVPEAKTSPTSPERTMVPELPAVSDPIFHV
ncbi:hypothetical protein KBC03_05115 [Patescibacteria group bacterium]|nr:hypothetical protein [Patescibacteria group bacterium]